MCLSVFKLLVNQEASTIFVPPSGEARAALKWADGKIIKNEVDVQVCFQKGSFTSRNVGTLKGPVSGIWLI